MSKLLEGKKILIVGVANKRSLAWAAAQACVREGASIWLTYQGDRIKENVLELAETIPGTPASPCDVTDEASLSALFAEIQGKWGRLDGLVHSVAFAPSADLERPFVETSRDGFRTALDVSAYSLAALCRHAQPAFKAAGSASVVAYTYLGSVRAVHGYNVMGVAKAALESAIRYLAADLGGAGVRVNGVSAGPVSTLSARGVSGFTKILDIVKERAPLRRNIEAAEVGDATAFLLSGLSRGITGEVLYVDAGFHCVGI